MPRGTPQILGEFEQVVLLAIMRLEEDAYGVTIRKEIRDCTGRIAAPGALYNTLDRLEEKGMVRSHFSDPSPQRGGRSKRLFHVTPGGIEAVAHAQRGYQRLMRSLKIPGVSHA